MFLRQNKLNVCETMSQYHTFATKEIWQQLQTSWRERKQREAERAKEGGAWQEGTFFLTTSDTTYTHSPSQTHKQTRTHNLDKKPGHNGIIMGVFTCVSACVCVCAYVYVWERSCSHNILFLNTQKEGNVCDDGWETHTYTPLTWVATGIPHLYHPLTHTYTHTHA